MNRGFTRIDVLIFAISVATCGATVTGVALADEALYRPDQPEVLEPRRTAPPADDGPQIIEAFRQSYAARGLPRIVLFWNRGFVDQLRDIKRKEKVTQVQNASSKTVEFQEDGSGGEIEDTSRRNTAVKTERTNEETQDQGKRTGPSEKFNWALEDAVVRGLTAVGANLVDRGAAMRFLAAESDMDLSTLDTKRIETGALLNKGDLLLEVLMTEDKAAPSGLVYRILVKEIGSGRMLASGVTDARPPQVQPTKRFRVGENGFEEVGATTDVSIGEVSKHLSKQVMKTLAMGLSR